MAAFPTPDPNSQQPPNDPTGGGAQGGGQDAGAGQANALQQGLAKLMQVTQTLGQQNTIIQPEMQEIAASLRKAFLKTTQAAQPQQPASAPPGQ